MSLGQVPFTPAPPAKESDRAWVAGYKRRHAGDALYNVVDAAEAASQNGALSRAWSAASASGERRHANRATAARIVADAAQDEALAAYQRERREVLGVIGRMKRGAPAGMISRSAGGGVAGCVHCQQCGFTAQESAEVHRGWESLTGAGHRASVRP